MDGAEHRKYGSHLSCMVTKKVISILSTSLYKTEWVQIAISGIKDSAKWRKTDCQRKKKIEGAIFIDLEIAPGSQNCVGSCPVNPDLCWNTTSSVAEGAHLPRALLAKMVPCCILVPSCHARAFQRAALCHPSLQWVYASESFLSCCVTVESLTYVGELGPFFWGDQFWSILESCTHASHNPPLLPWPRQNCFERWQDWILPSLVDGAFKCSV